MQSTALAPRLRRNTSRPIVRPPGDRLYHTVRLTSAEVQSELELKAAPWRFVTQYIKGWAQADPSMIAGAAIDGYRFYDPLVGVFTEQRLSPYFEFLRTRFARDGVRAQPAFYLHGPMDGCTQGEFMFF